MYFRLPTNGLLFFSVILYNNITINIQAIAWTLYLTRKANFIQTFIHCPPWHGHASSLYCLWSLTCAQLKKGGRDHCLLNMMGSATTPHHYQQIIVLSLKTRRALLWAMILQKVSEEKSQVVGGIQCFTRRPLICNTSTSKRRSIFEECGNWYCWQNCRHSSLQHLPLSAN